MAQPPSRWAVRWFRFNIVMFSAYALFGTLSLFWPSALERLWLYPLHLGGLAFNLAILYGLARRRLWTTILIVLYGAGMVAHLLIFIFVPISMAIAYVGPSRSFYTLVIDALSHAGAGQYAMDTVRAFNALMALVHTINIFFFLKSGATVLKPRVAARQQAATHAS